jgi:mono/diheme cytochrome c family protein
VATILAVSASGCDPAAREPDPAEEVAASVEAIDPALLASLPPGATAETLEQGRRLYVVCSVCHGLDAHGTQLGPSLRRPDWIHIEGGVEEIEQIVRSGVANPREYPIPMPVMGGGDFDEAELRAVATYVDAMRRSGP